MMIDSLPDELPVMTLPNVVLFPKTVLPLHIFEPRYRQMLEDVLESSHRAFAVAALDVQRLFLAGASEPPHRVATAGIIGACQKNDDGTSDLLLVGTTRVAITEIIREEPYRLIRVSPLPDEVGSSQEKLEELRRELLRVFDIRLKLGLKLPGDLSRAIREIEDPGALCDLLVFATEGDTRFKQSMLETLDTAARLERVIARFRRDTARMRLQRRLQGPLPDENIPNN